MWTGYTKDVPEKLFSPFFFISLSFSILATVVFLLLFSFVVVLVVVVSTFSLFVCAGDLFFVYVIADLLVSRVSGASFCSFFFDCVLSFFFHMNLKSGYKK